MAVIETVTREIKPLGLGVLGGFHPAAGDGVPGDPGTVILVINAGPDMWRVFSDCRAEDPDPLDAWTRAVLEGVAARLGADALFPFDGPPYLPFQRWAARAAAVHLSPMGALIHRQYGLWHAYRGALAFADAHPLPPPSNQAGPCETCRDRPCLGTCPVGAIGEGGFNAAACADHISRDEGRDCLEHACAARRACPVGRDYIYGPEQARFHMENFRKNQGHGHGG